MNENAPTSHALCTVTGTKSATFGLPRSSLATCATGDAHVVGVALGQVPPGHGVAVSVGIGVDVGVDVGPAMISTCAPTAVPLISKPSGSLNDGSRPRFVGPTASGWNSNVARIPDPLAPGGGGEPSVPQPNCKRLKLPDRD